MIIGSNIIFSENLPSTNVYAAGILKEQNVKEGTIFQTNFQSAGRGQAGNGWESEDGKNLLISIILFPTMINPADQFIISMAVSLGICDFLQRHITTCSIKWPNDIYVSNDKIAGILIENSVMGEVIENCVAGIGLNINQTVFKSDAPNPVSLKLLTGKDSILSDSLIQLASDLDKRYKQLLSEQYDRIRGEYISKLYRLNEWNSFRDKNGLFEGKIVSVRDNGILEVESKSRKQTEYSFKEIEFII
jgi:BirA family transcriptional regulator, biotin operon repressor / biotin---[acetyl-CoA-carboxylase] ligase